MFTSGTTGQPHGVCLTQGNLASNAAMTANLALYPRLGYRRTGRRVENGYDRVYFEKELA